MPLTLRCQARLPQAALNKDHCVVTVVMQADAVLACVAWTSEKSHDVKVEAAVGLKGYYIKDVMF